MKETRTLLRCSVTNFKIHFGFEHFLCVCVCVVLLFQQSKMLMEIVEVFTDMVNCSLFPEAYEQLTQARRKKLGEWTTFEDSLADSSGAWLPQIVREIRYTYIVVG